MIAIDGACKRNGQPTCSSIGVAWIQTHDGNLLFKSKFETSSTSQRGEINGLLQALYYAAGQALADEYIIIITDSEYIYNTVMNGWCFKWRQNGWVNADSNPTKNADLWDTACRLLDEINKDTERVFLQWTKGHCVHYTPGNIKKAMREDQTGIELYSRITAVANRPADIDNILKKFHDARAIHGHTKVPDATALKWAIANATADAIASYTVQLLDDVLI